MLVDKNQTVTPKINGETQKTINATLSTSILSRYLTTAMILKTIRTAHEQMLQLTECYKKSSTLKEINQGASQFCNEY